VVPPWFKSVDLPELPEDIPSAFIPNAPKFRRHAVIDSDLTEGYAELRRRPLSPAVDEAVFGIDGRHTLRANGTERISWLGKGR
jgi:hypothetical protein